MKLPPHNYQLKFQQTEELLRKLSGENRIKKYLETLQIHSLHTLRHSFRVALLCVDLGFENEFEEKNVQLLGYAGLLHDIGKVQIPLKLLDKNSFLNSFERELMGKHTQLGSQSVHGFEDNLKRIVIGHHEYQTSPYPRKEERRIIGRKEKDRRGNNLLVEGLTKILAAADLYDALRSERTYKPSKNKSETRIIMLHQYTGDLKYIDQLLTR